MLLRPFKQPFGTAVALIGLAGLPDDVATWQRWIDVVTRDERVLALAEQAATFGEWIGQPGIRIALVAVGLLLILWRAPWFWRLRHRVVFNWRRLLAEEVWIDREAAIDLLRNSTWGQMKRPMVSVLDSFASGLAAGSGGMTAAQKTHRKFRVYLEVTLESFETYNEASVRLVEGEKEYEQGALARFARNAIEQEVEEEFGRVPRGSA